MPGRRILVVDDNTALLGLLAGMLKEAGLEVRAADSGRAALRLLEQGPVDLVLLDIIMPGMNGLEVLRRLKDRRPALPVIMVTASAAIDNAIIALREGADDFFRKPVDLDELVLCVTRVLGKVRVAKRPPPPPPEPGSERRRTPRIRMEQGSPAQLQLKEVYLLDVSLSGALVEHSEPVNPGEIYRLTFPVEGKEVQVLARAVRAFASHRITTAGGERRIVYGTGMEFVGVEKGASELISACMDRLAKLGPGETAT